MGGTLSRVAIGVPRSGIIHIEIDDICHVVTPQRWALENSG
jgi:hypothetical protein